MDKYPEHCLFFQEYENCNSFSKEHIIQKKLGGSLASENLICRNCNNYFSQALDNELIKLYKPILINLAPIIGGYLKKTFMDIDPSKELLPIKVKAGGVAGLKKGYG